MYIAIVKVCRVILLNSLDSDKSDTGQKCGENMRVYGGIKDVFRVHALSAYPQDL